MTPEELESVFVDLVEKREIDKVRATIRTAAAGLPDGTADDIFQHACLEVVRRNEAGGDLSNIPGLLVTIGRRHAWRLRKDRDEAEELSAALGRGLDESLDWAMDEARQEQIDRAVAWVKEKVEMWPSGNLRRVMMTIIDAAREGVQLQPKDLAARLDCPPKHAGVWRNRAEARLRKAAEDDGVCWESIATPLGDDLQEDDHDLDGVDDDVEGNEEEL